MTKREFRDKGYLQEANRLFFHPLGLALAMEWDEDNPADLDTDVSKFLLVYDARYDPEGYYFAEALTDPTFKQKAEMILAEIRKRFAARTALFGGRGHIQPFATEPPITDLIDDLMDQIREGCRLTKEDLEMIPADPGSFIR